MGMFDSIRCEWPLPDGGDGSDMQTKSLGCCLTQYVIAADGRLRHVKGSDSGFHGIMRFYAHDPGTGRREYEAKFSDGQLDHLVPVAQARFDEDGMALKPTARP